ncbi:MAG: hypothetical protein ABI051_15650 [Vicinamibacterales bacterium]
MDVYFVPAGADRYELYCETVALPVDPGDSGRTSMWASLWNRMVHVFRRAVAEGEEQRTEGPSEHQQGRIRRTITRKLADAVAEQRLLWQLRRLSAVTLHHPDDLSGDRAIELTRTLLATDRDKHFRWCVIDGVLVLVCTPAALLPGPNVLAYYFIFRTVGHYLSMKGATRGLTGVSWNAVASSRLTEVRAVLPLGDSTRAGRLQDISQALGLDRLGLFLDRVAERAP